MRPPRDARLSEAELYTQRAATLGLFVVVDARARVPLYMSDGHS